jgi:prolyl 4-hydroxylase
MNLPIDHGEGLQVLRYGPGTRYTPHFDFLVPRSEDSEQSLRRSGQRVSSLVAYLNDVPGGGETIFPHVGLSVCPQPCALSMPEARHRDSQRIPRMH